MLYFADAKWWRWHRERDEFRAFAGEKCSIWSSGNEIDDPQVNILRNAGSEGLSDDAGALCTGSNSGYQAVNLAYLAGAARIVLVGYDAKPGPKGERHWFGDHPDRSSAPYAHMVKAFRELAGRLAAAGIEVINATPASAIECFRKEPLETALLALQGNEIAGSV